ncbi:MAG: hypothetical protein LBP33_00900 [Candidatus Adiutrix sp.]|nr:hypothetical protein [Candidatus Adiutrix sp.]
MHLEKILILAKTYPVPSAKYEETTCVAGITDNGQMRRLFPIQFRFIDGEKQFKKWQWISARVKKAPKDHRAESHIINSESIVCQDVITTDKFWQARKNWIDLIPSFKNMSQLEKARQEHGVTLALIRPKKMIALDITPEDSPNWTQDEINKLRKSDTQGDLFRDSEPNKPSLEKIPFAFHYRYILQDDLGNEVEQRHKILDWEVCQLYRRLRREKGLSWEGYFREKLENEFFTKDLSLFIGTMQRIPYQWLIISLIYPPLQPEGSHEQRSFSFS